MKDETAIEQSSFKQSTKNHKWQIVALILILGLLTFSFNFSILGVSGESMNPTLQNGQLLFSRKTFMSLDRFDIVVCLDDNQVPIIKRIIGLPGETIEYKNNILYINNKVIEENYSIGNTQDFKVQIDNDNYFCLGDNREHSRDSRIIGQIPKVNIIAEVLL